MDIMILFTSFILSLMGSLIDDLELTCSDPNSEDQGYFERVAEYQ